MTQSREQILAMAKAIAKDISDYNKPPEDGLKPDSNQVMPFSLVKGSRGYIEKMVDQINGTYEKGCYDACAVMIRKLVETLIIETYEAHTMASNIQNSTGDFFALRELIATIVAEKTAWNLSRNSKSALPNFKGVGDLSAHNRRFSAHRHDIDKIIPDLRVVVQELLSIAKLK